jgi:hypothetical protein
LPESVSVSSSSPLPIHGSDRHPATVTVDGGSPIFVGPTADVSPDDAKATKLKVGKSATFDSAVFATALPGESARVRVERPGMG